MRKNEHISYIGTSESDPARGCIASAIGIGILAYQFGFLWRNRHGDSTLRGSKPWNRHLTDRKLAT